MLTVRLAGVALLLAAGARADIVRYEGETFPEELGWDRVGTFDADRWLQDGWLYQAVDLGIYAPPPAGEQDDYEYALAQFSGAPFFVDWRVQTAARRSEIDGVGGAALILAGGGVLYDFTIAEDTVRLLRGIQFDPVWLNIEPNVPHTYRLEIDGERNFEWFIDGELVISDVPEGDFPNAAGILSWGARFWLSDSTTRWDYIRYGAIPEPGTGLLLLSTAGLFLFRRFRSRE